MTVDCTTVTDRDPVVYTALQTLAYSVIVTTWPRATSKKAATVNDSLAAPCHSMLRVDTVACCD